METKRQEDIRKLMQMPEEAIASLNESEADRLGRLAVMFYKETGDIYLVADVLGHKDVNTTKKHYAAIDEDRRRQAANIVKLREV